MRSVTVFCLLTALCASADAATAHRSKPLHVIVRDKRGLSLGFTAPGWTVERARPPIHYRQTPSYDDPSKYGGGEAKPIQLWDERRATLRPHPTMNDEMNEHAFETDGIQALSVDEVCWHVTGCSSRASAKCRHVPHLDHEAPG